MKSDMEILLEIAQGVDPAEKIKALMRIVEETQAIHTSLRDLLKARDEMVKIAIETLQRIAIERREIYTSAQAQAALDRMHSLWKAAEAKCFDAEGDACTKNSESKWK